MKLWRPVLAALVLAGMAGMSVAQEIPGKKGSGGVLPRQPKKVSAFPKTYGTSNLSYYRMGANEFTGAQTGGTAFDLWSDTFYQDTATFGRYGTHTDAFFIGTPHLPSGALVTGIDFEGCANSDTSVLTEVYSCEADGKNCTGITAMESTAGCGLDHLDISGSNFVVDNSPNANYLVILVVTGNTDGSDSLAGAVVEYTLQVSAAPLTSDFNDVATSSPQFKFIEALYYAGITAGCGGGNFCPDNPVTRGQMAVFLAKALGLQWP
jgi:hypothetical protein